MRAWLQWGRGCVATEMSVWYVTEKMVCDASMGPWLCSHGNLDRWDHMEHAQWLQWGRGCVATEMRLRNKDLVRAGLASMGPWLCSHGNTTCSLGIGWCGYSFNGAVAV